MNIFKKSIIPGIVLCLTLFTVGASAGVLVAGAQNIANEITEVVATIAGALLILWTLTSMSGGMGSRLILALIEGGIFFFIIENPNTITSFFRMGG